MEGILCDSEDFRTQHEPKNRVARRNCHFKFYFFKIKSQEHTDIIVSASVLDFIPNIPERKLFE